MLSLTQFSVSQQSPKRQHSLHGEANAFLSLWMTDKLMISQSGSAVLLTQCQTGEIIISMFTRLAGCRSDKSGMQLQNVG